MENEDQINNASFNSSIIPQNIADSLEGVDEMSMKQQRKDRYSQDTRFRKHLAKWVMYIVPIWLGLVMIILFFNGFNLINIDSSVLISLLATTTVNVLGLAYIVLKGIFNHA